MNQPITRADPLADQVHRYLRDEILSCRIQPGARIVESKVAKTLAISRSPVREAIRQLEQEGLVNSTGQGLTMVFEPSQKDFEDLYELRLSIEPMAAQLAAERITERGIVQLEDVLTRIGESMETRQIESFIDSNSQFHDLIVQHCGNPRIQKVLNEVSALARYYRYFIFKVFHRRLEAAEEHWSIYRAIRDGSPEEAWRLMNRHLQCDLAYVLSIRKTVRE